MSNPVVMIFTMLRGVLKLATIIQTKEGGNLEVISIAALVHDMYRSWEKETGKSHFGDEALEMMRTFMRPLIANVDTVDTVIELVRYHDIYDWTEPREKSIELKILQDADNLDALGAIGIARAFAFGGSNALEIYNPDDSLEFKDDFVDSPSDRTSTIAHFYEKLLKLKDNMNTETGRKMAQSRHEFMENYLQQFFNEWNLSEELEI